jgi:hypothetical protein
LKEGGFYFVLVVVGGEVGKAGFRLKQGCEGVDDQKNDENVVDIEPSLLLAWLTLLALCGCVSSEGICISE